MDWNQLKLALEIITGLDKDALHVHVGVLTQVGIALLMRRTLASPWPCLALLAAVFANEYYDLTYEIWPPEERQRQYLEGVRDLWNTMVMPTLLMLLCRFAPAIFLKPAPVDEPAG